MPEAPCRTGIWPSAPGGWRNTRARSGSLLALLVSRPIRCQPRMHRSREASTPPQAWARARGCSLRSRRCSACRTGEDGSWRSPPDASRHTAMLQRRTWTAEARDPWGLPQGLPLGRTQSSARGMSFPARPRAGCPRCSPSVEPAPPRATVASTDRVCLRRRSPLRPAHRRSWSSRLASAPCSAARRSSDMPPRRSR
jgi:hypothetical protein